MCRAGEVCAYDLNLGRFSCRPLDPEFDCPTCPDCECVTNADCPDCHTCTGGQCENNCASFELCCDNTCTDGECCNRHDCGENQLCFQNTCIGDVSSGLVCKDPITLSDIADVVRACRNAGTCSTDLYYGMISFDFTETATISKSQGSDSVYVDNEHLVCSNGGDCCDYSVCVTVEEGTCERSRFTSVNFDYDVDGIDVNFSVLCPAGSVSLTTESCSTGYYEFFTSTGFLNLDWFNVTYACPMLRNSRNTDSTSGAGFCARSTEQIDNNNGCFLKINSF